MPPRTPMFMNAREFMVRSQQDERKAFIVAQQHVVGRAITFDKLRLQQQSLSLAVSRHNRHRPRLRHHPLQPLRQPLDGCVAAYPVFQCPRLANIQNITTRVVHPVDARFGGQRSPDIADCGNARLQIGLFGATHGIGRLFLVKSRGSVGLVGAVGFGHCRS